MSTCTNLRFSSPTHPLQRTELYFKEMSLCKHHNVNMMERDGNADVGVCTCLSLAGTLPFDMTCRISDIQSWRQRNEQSSIFHR